VGEVPLHYYLTDEELIVAKKISDIKDYLGPENFVYQFVRAVPHVARVTSNAAVSAAQLARFGCSSATEGDF
jgi:hypothetical protein